MVPWPLRITEDTLCLAATQPPALFNYYPDVASAQADLPRANGGGLAPQGGYHILTYGAYLRGMRAYYLGQPLRPCSRQQFWYALEVLPPQAYHATTHFTRFCMSEYQQDNYTKSYACLGNAWGKDARHAVYVYRYVDATDSATWITPDEIEAWLAPPTTPSM
jgi:hypothetical protein